MKRIEIVPFRERSVRISRNFYGQMYLCAGDICEIVRRSDLLKNGAIAGICPTAMKVPFRRNGRDLWAFRPIDMHRLLGVVRKESILPPRYIDELEQWGSTLLETERTEMQGQSYTDTTIHFGRDMPVTFRRIGDKLMVNATQLTMPYNHLPSEWLRIAATDDLRRRLAQKGMTDRYEFQIFTTRGRNHGATWIESPLVAALAQWVAPEAGLAAWCEAQIDMLDSRYRLRRHHRKPLKPLNIPCLAKPMPEDRDTALKMIEELRALVRVYAPKAAFYDEYVENREWFCSTRIADELNITSRHLHRFLAEQGVCKYQKGQWVVSATYRSWQCDIPYTWENAQGRLFTFGSVKRWTPIGREAILELWSRLHPEFA